MSNPAEVRKDRRYSISEYLEDEFRNVYVEIMANPPVRAVITDISMNGLGFVIPEDEKEGRKNVEQADKFFINIHLGGEIILLDTIKTWGSAVKVKEGTVYRGGVLFTMVSPNDRLTLHKFLENIRIRA